MTVLELTPLEIYVTMYLCNINGLGMVLDRKVLLRLNVRLWKGKKKSFFVYTTKVIMMIK